MLALLLGSLFCLVPRPGDLLLLQEVLIQCNLRELREAILFFPLDKASSHDAWCSVLQQSLHFLSAGMLISSLSLSLLHFALLVFVLGCAYFRYFCQVLFSELYLLIPVWEAAIFRTIHLPVLSIVSTGWLAVFLRWIYFALVRVWCGGLHTFFFLGSCRRYRRWRWKKPVQCQRV